MIRIGTTGDYPPFSKLENNNYWGIDIDIAKYLSEQLNIEIEFVKTTWQTLHEDFKNKKFDIAISGIAINSERKSFSYFTKPYYHSGKTAITHINKKNTFLTLESANNENVNILVNEGGTNEKFANKHFKKSNIIKKKTNIDIFSSILNLETDIMFTDSIEAEYVESHNSLLIRSMPDELFEPFDISIMTQNTLLRDSINIILGKLKRNGKLDKIIKNNLKKK